MLDPSQNISPALKCTLVNQKLQQQISTKERSPTTGIHPRPRSNYAERANENPKKMKKKMFKQKPITRKSIGTYRNSEIFGTQEANR